MLKRIANDILSLIVVLLFAIGLVVVSPFMLAHYIKRRLKGDNHA